MSKNKHIHNRPSSLWKERSLKVSFMYRGAIKSLARPGRKPARKHVRDASNFNNIETRSVIKFFFFLQGKAPKEIHAILTEILACVLPGRAKDLSAPLYSAYFGLYPLHCDGEAIPYVVYKRSYSSYPTQGTV